jgi:hypothetical protein
MARLNPSSTLVGHTPSKNAQNNNASIAEKAREIILPTLTQPKMMELARNQATFDSSKLTEIIFGG